MIHFLATLIYIFELTPRSIEDASFHSFVFMFAFSERRGLAMCFFLSIIMLANLVPGEQMRRRVLWSSSDCRYLYCTALISDRLDIFLLLLGEGYSDFFFFLCYCTDSVIQQNTETEKE